MATKNHKHPTKNKTKSAWDFVEENYPNYHSSQEIAKNDDLHKLANGEQEDGDSADRLLRDEYGGNEDNAHIQLDLNESLVRIYELSIENFYVKQRYKV